MSKNKQVLNPEIAIKVEDLSKSFRVPHQKIDSVRGAFVNLFSRKSYENFNALDNVSFEIKKGEFVGILGHNGSGKSTLLKCLARVYSQDSGDIKINGEISPFLELGIGFNPELSGRDNIYLNATILGLSPREIEDSFGDIVEFSEIGGFIDQQVKNYSSGMRGRLAFSVSIHANRDILLMDEVLAVGDAQFQKKCLDQFKSYRERNKTVILVTHDLGTIRKHCDKVILLHKGSVRMIGTAEKVAEQYFLLNMTKSQRKEYYLKLQREKIQEERSQIEMKAKAEAEAKAEAQAKVDAEAKMKAQMLKVKEEAIKKKDEKPLTGPALVSGIAKINKVVFLDADQKEMVHFDVGSNISIRLYYESEKVNSSLSFGFGIYRKDGVYLAGIHSLLEEDAPIISVSDEYVQVTLKNIPLNRGDYYLKVSIAGDSAPPFYDYKESGMFSLRSNSKNQEGFVKLDYSWDSN